MALAGTQLTITPGEPWWASVRREHWPAALTDEIEAGWDAQHGDRKTAMVCIGQDLDHAAALAELEACWRASNLPRTFLEPSRHLG